MRAADGAFCVLLALAAVIGGSHAVAGIPALLAIVTPPGIAVAQASSSVPDPVAWLVVTAPIAPGPHSPQVLRTERDARHSLAQAR
ncbi:MAG TPA: hypothetical protein VJ476_07415 [Rhizomicrobium sp.]|nr:hypothetical protein [Rhizomicrobium sp.]